MNLDTFSHGLWTYLIMRTHQKALPAVIGAVTPDAPGLITAFALLLKGKLDPFGPIMPQLYSNHFWRNTDSAMHSLLIWTPILLGAWFFQLNLLKWLALGGHFHIGIDLLTHLKFSSAYMWPLWDSQFTGLVDYMTVGFNVINGISLLAFLLWIRHKRRV